MDKSKVLVLGRGFLGKQFEKNGYTVWGRGRFDLNVVDIDLTYIDFWSNMFEGFDIIINCIGNANTRFCENADNWDEVFKVNSELPKFLSNLCNMLDKKFVQISSGCVYDRNDRPQLETDNITSHCNYVVSKIAGEMFCNANDLIIRPRLFFGETEDKNNLLCKVSKFTKFLTEINSYTSVQTIVESTQALLENKCVGVFNVSNRGYTNLVDIAKACGIEVVNTLNADELIKQEKLFLVNNVMDTTKLEKYYQPRNILDEIKSCWASLLYHTTN